MYENNRRKNIVNLSNFILRFVKHCKILKIFLLFFIKLTKPFSVNDFFSTVNNTNVEHILCSFHKKNCSLGRNLQKCFLIIY